MKPPTEEELRMYAQMMEEMSDNPDRFDKVVTMALIRWADQIERKRNHISHFTRKKARAAQAAKDSRVAT